MKKQMTEEIQAEILEKYRSKKTPEGRRELIRSLLQKRSGRSRSAANLQRSGSRP